jgi:hypothetical protein
MLLVATFFVFSLVSATAAKIEGAFGLKLGDVFHPPNDLAGAKQTEREIRYPFTPETANKIFSEYYVFITPTSHRIYRIVALAKYRDGNAGYKVSQAISALLRQKYGEPGKITGSARGEAAIIQNSRSVDMINDASGPDGVTFHVNYEDRDLALEAEEERMAIIIKDVDTTGL